MGVVVLAIKGNYLDRVSEIFECFQYTDNNNDIVFDEVGRFYSFLDEQYFNYYKKEITIRGIGFDSGWTLIFDPELCDVRNRYEALELLYDKFHSEIQVFFFGLSDENQIVVEKEFLVSQGWIISFCYNWQKYIGKEVGTRPISPTEIEVEDVLKLTNDLGFGVGEKRNGTYIVKQLFDTRNPDYTLHKVNIEDYDFDEE